jgi:hypothetical protein
MGTSAFSTADKLYPRYCEFLGLTPGVYRYSTYTPGIWKICLRYTRIQEYPGYTPGIPGVNGNKIVQDYVLCCYVPLAKANTISFQLPIFKKYEET